MNKIFFPAILVLILVYILHIIGFTYAFYTTVWWYDVMMHILGGIGIALSLFWFFKTLNKDIEDRGIYFRVVIFTVVAGLMWEGIETYYRIAGAPVGTIAYYVDTIKDLIDDTLGAFIALFLLKIFKKQ